MGKMKRRLLAEQDRRLKAMTLGEVKDQGYDIFCWCNRCSHNAEVPVDLLMAQFGPAYPVPELGLKLRCSGCGSKDIATRPAWPSLGQVTRHLDETGD